MKAQSIMTISFFLGIQIFSSGVTLLLLLRFFIGDKILIIRILNYLMPWYLWIITPAMIIAWWVDNLFTAIICLIPAIIIITQYLHQFLPSTRHNVKDTNNIKIMSYNTWYGNKNMDMVAELILSERPDILLLQETGKRQFENLLAKCKNLYPDSKFYYAYDSNSMQSVITRFRINSSAPLKKKGRALKVHICLPNYDLIVYNVHPHRGQWLSRHKRIVRLLEEEIIANKYPVILGGDFNTTEQSQTYKFVTKYLKNAHRSAGFGFGFTFPSPYFKFMGRFRIPALVRIDHLFFDHNFKITSCRTNKHSGGSDHFPIVAEFTRTGTI